MNDAKVVAHEGLSSRVSVHARVYAPIDVVEIGQS